MRTRFQSSIVWQIHVFDRVMRRMKTIWFTLFIASKSVFQSKSSIILEISFDHFFDTIVTDFLSLVARGLRLWSILWSRLGFLGDGHRLLCGRSSIEFQIMTRLLQRIVSSFETDFTLNFKPLVSDNCVDLAKGLANIFDN